MAPCFWGIDAQQGPFDSRWIFDFPENEELVDKQFFDLPVLRNTSYTCWHSGTFPRLAEHIVADKWTCFYAMRCSEEDVLQRAEWIWKHADKFGEDFFRQLDKTSDLFLMHLDGWWELYTSDAEWRRKFRQSFPESFERPWQKAGEVPENLPAKS